jgi:SAM-dependent methyltransferase
MRLLVAIASYGEKNIDFLKSIIRRYKSMPMDVDVVVLSEAPKHLGPEVEVVVGLPSRNPWSLPFAHKKIFADRVDQYDLFAYSEDDMEVTEANIYAFLDATAALEPEEIAGHVQYEIDSDGTWTLPAVHGPHHWKVDSVRRRGDFTVAEFTNVHAAFYILTQAQLRRAIASGGFLRDPYEGRYDMLCTAATDPYTCCGFRKVICVSALDKFLIHHLPNRYAGRVGLRLSEFEAQIQILMAILDGRHPATVLCDTQSRMLHGKWSKLFYEDPTEEVLSIVPETAQSILSVGCGSGATEGRLKERGAEIYALPLDSVIGAVAERRGINVVYGTLRESLRTFDGQKFDCVLLTNFLHLLPDPWSALEHCARLVRLGGALVVAGPNFELLPALAKRFWGWGDYRKLRSFAESGISVVGSRRLKNELRRAGLRIGALRWFNCPTPWANILAARPALGRFLAREWAILARR